MAGVTRTYKQVTQMQDRLSAVASEGYARMKAGRVVRPPGISWARDLSKLLNLTAELRRQAEEAHWLAQGIYAEELLEHFGRVRDSAVLLHEITKSTVSPEETEFHLHELADEFRRKIDLGEVKLSCKKGARVRGNRYLLLRALQNFYLNAKDHGEAQNMWLTGKREKGKAVLEFTDDGKGIPAENLPKVFDMHFTTKKESTDAGLGLAQAKQAVEEHGGTVSVKSRVATAGRKGRTTFRVELPLSTGK